jgi:hypothetical protein
MSQYGLDEGAVDFGLESQPGAEPGADDAKVLIFSQKIVCNTPSTQTPPNALQGEPEMENAPYLSDAYGSEYDVLLKGWVDLLMLFAFIRAAFFVFPHVALLQVIRFRSWNCCTDAAGEFCIVCRCMFQRNGRLI